jgi:hypothetical protein
MSLTGHDAIAAHNRAQRLTKRASAALDMTGVQDEPRVKAKLKEARTLLESALANLRKLTGTNTTRPAFTPPADAKKEAASA